MARDVLLPTDIAARLAKLAGMFGSAHAGERANAAQMADRLVRDSGLTWFDVIRPAAPAAEMSHEREWREPRNWREAITAALNHEGSLTDWESSFVRSLRTFRRLTPRQSDVLWKIIDRLRDLARDEVAA